ncbi:MAG: hypothetical protein J6H18_02325 [Lachnospiraceae bacterium]|nr:hypothetical protein [Lachnospiraceae bacterium]
MKKWILILIAGLILLAAGLMLIPAGTIRWEGGDYYSREELTEMIFGDTKPRYLAVRLQEWLGKHREIPFIDHYEILFESGLDLRVRLYERSLAGLLRFQDYYLYFDWSGTVVESSAQRIEGIFEVSGLTLDHAVVGEKLPVTDRSAIDSILTIGQFLTGETVLWKGEEKKLSDLTQRIRFGSEGVSVVLEDIEAVLGSHENMDAKLFLLADILPKLSGREGTLYLNQYKTGATREQYIFKEKERSR